MDNIAEMWAPVVGYEGLYEVSNLGQVRSMDRMVKFSGTMAIRTGIMLKLKTDKYGYKYIRLSKLGEDKHKTVHRLVAMAFIPNPENRSQVNHINGIKDDNRVENLEWATPKENTQHAKRTGLLKPARGEASPNAKLTEAMVLEIKASRHITGQALAEKYGVRPSVISKIRNGLAWSHIGPKPKRTRFTAMQKGESNPRARLTQKDVLEIRSIEGWTFADIGRLYNLDATTISRIRARKIWQHI